MLNSARNMSILTVLNLKVGILLYNYIKNSKCYMDSNSHSFIKHLQPKWSALKHDNI
jgi:hypothetical protein